MTGMKREEKLEQLRKNAEAFRDDAESIKDTIYSIEIKFETLFGMFGLEKSEMEIKFESYFNELKPFLVQTEELMRSIASAYENTALVEEIDSNFAESLK